MDKIVLQKLCREYLSRLRYMADKHGLGGWLRDIRRANKRNECVATENEVRMLSRLVDDERVGRKDIPKILGKSYRQASEDGDFERIKKLKHTGIYSKVSVILFKAKNYGRTNKRGA